MKAWISRYWPLVMGAGLLLSILVISFIGYSAVGLYQDSKSFLTTLKSSNQVSATQRVAPLIDTAGS
jgi:hypothetical protein